MRRMTPTSRLLDSPAQVVKSAESNKRDQVTCVCCPYPFLAPVSDIIKGSKVSLGAEDVFHEDKGAFTGGVSIGMLKSVGVEYVLVGHSERRQGNIAHETDAEINRKLRKVCFFGDSQLTPRTIRIICTAGSVFFKDHGALYSPCMHQTLILHHGTAFLRVYFGGLM
jgi:triosephosphate isomerase